MGAGGRGALTLSGGGALNLDGGTEMFFRNASSLATIRVGTVEVRTLQAGRSLEIQFGSQVTYLPFFEAQSAGTVTVGADRAARIECRAGSVSLTAIQGTGVVSLGPGRFVTITLDGRLGTIGPGTPSGQTPGAPKPAAKSNSHVGYIVLGVGAAGAGVGIALAASHKGQPVSPSSP